jgi:hypothetical protein
MHQCKKPAPELQSKAGFTPTDFQPNWRFLIMTTQITLDLDDLHEAITLYVQSKFKDLSIDPKAVIDEILINDTDGDEMEIEEVVVRLA